MSSLARLTIKLRENINFLTNPDSIFSEVGLLINLIILLRVSFRARREDTDKPDNLTPG